MTTQTADIIDRASWDASTNPEQMLDFLQKNIGSYGITAEAIDRASLAMLPMVERYLQGRELYQRSVSALRGSGDRQALASELEDARWDLVRGADSLRSGYGADMRSAARDAFGADVVKNAVAALMYAVRGPRDETFRWLPSAIEDTLRLAHADMFFTLRNEKIDATMRKICAVIREHVSPEFA